MIDRQPDKQTAERASQRVVQKLAIKDRPVVGIVLGSGLGGIADCLQSARSIAYHEIPGFQQSTAGGHQGRLIYGLLAGVPTIVMAGRYHRYEGWSNQTIAFPIEVMARLGALHLVVSNAAGGVNPRLSVGDLVVITDHLNWLGRRNGLETGISDSGSSDPSPSADKLAMGSTRRVGLYDPQLVRLAQRAAIQAGFSMMTGTYLATLGPNYETRAEYRMMRRLGADMVGMSTVPEVLAAGRLGMKVLGISMISNVANPDRPVLANHDEVLETGRAAAGTMEAVVRGVVVSLSPQTSLTLPIKAAT